MNTIIRKSPWYIFCRNNNFPTSNGFKNRFQSLSNASGSLVAVVEDEKTKTAIVTLQKPPVNSLNLELLQDLTAAIKDLEKKRFKGFVLASNSPTVFSGGLDIMEMYNAKEERFRAFWKALQQMWKTLYLTPLITMAAINGHAPAGGCMMALSCDYSIMVKSKATIGMNETLLGIAAPKWFRTLMINNMGFRRAEKALYLGSLFTPEEALSLNIVDELAADAEDLQNKIQHQMGMWLKIPGPARQMTKLGLRKPFVDELISYENEELEQVVQIILNEQTQKFLGKYIEALKSKRS